MKAWMFVAGLLCMAACSGDDAACETGAFQCGEGEILEECVDEAWTVSDDCAAEGLECHAEMGHCMDGGMTGMSDM